MSKNKRLNLTDAVNDLAPPAPPCMPGQVHWVEYLTSAAAAQSGRNEPKVILYDADGNPRFNSLFPLCVDCYGRRRDQMRAQGRCNPDYLRHLEQKEAAK